MNLNDLRANAYGRAVADSNKRPEKEDGVSVEIKAFSPPRLTSEQLRHKNAAVHSGRADAPKNDGVAAPGLPARKAAPSGDAARQSSSARLDETSRALKSGGLVKVPVSEPQSDGKDSVYRRVAKFLLLIGEDEAAKILPHLSEKQIERIIPEIASIRTVSKEESLVILEEFNSLLEKAKTGEGVETAREMLEKAYGKARASQMLEKAVPARTKKPFEYLQDADKERVYQLLKDENAGVQAMVLTHLEPKKSAAVINLMSENEKKEAVLRLARMDKISPEILRRVDQAMYEKSLTQTAEKVETLDGRNALAQILKKMDAGAEKDIITSLSREDPDLGQDLKSRLFTIDDVLRADDKFVQQKLRELPDSDVAYLIAGKNDDFREKILCNMSRTRREEILTQEELLKPMRKYDVDRSTSEFFNRLRRAFEEGFLIIKDRNEDAYV